MVAVVVVVLVQDIEHLRNRNSDSGGGLFTYFSKKSGHKRQFTSIYHQFTTTSSALSTEDVDIMVEIKGRVRLMRTCLKRFGPELYTT